MMGLSFNELMIKVEASDKLETTIGNFRQND